jgi:TonB family protein
LNQLATNQMLGGRVVSKDGGKPINGALVKISGTDLTAKTNADGRFSIKADSNHSSLVVANNGYKTRTLTASSRDTTNNISLEPNDNDLAETVVTGYASDSKDDTTQEVVGAHPVQGWGAYRKYLKKNAVMTNGLEGVVRLVFTVDKKGNFSNIKVKKGVSASIDKKAIDLIKTGPTWVGSSNKKPEEIHLRIHFTK